MVYNEFEKSRIWKYYGDCVYLGGGRVLSKESYIIDNMDSLSYDEIRDIMEEDVYIVEEN